MKIIFANTLLSSLAQLAAMCAADAPAKSRNEAKTAGGKPNVLLVITDDQG